MTKALCEVLFAETTMRTKGAIPVLRRNDGAYEDQDDYYGDSVFVRMVKYTALFAITYVCTTTIRCTGEVMKSYNSALKFDDSAEAIRYAIHEADHKVSEHPVLGPLAKEERSSNAY